jgi:predicted transcriptional regulator
MADANMIIRVDPELKQNFDWACSVADNTASQLLRKYMRDFVTMQMTKEASQVVIEESDADGAQFLYDKNDAAEVLNIKKKIFLCREFEKLHPEVPLADYNERERIKREAHGVVLNRDLSVAKRTDAAVGIIKAHYQRSAQSSLNPDSPSSINRHPGFSEYAKHYVKSVSLAKTFGDDVYDELVRRFPLDGPSRMGDTPSWPST